MRLADNPEQSGREISGEFAWPLTFGVGGDANNGRNTYGMHTSSIEIQSVQNIYHLVTADF